MQAATLGSSLAVAGAANLSDVLNVTGASHLSSTLLVDQAATLGSSLAVAGAANLSGVMNVTGASHLSSTLLVDQAATLGSSLAVAGASNLNGVMNVAGASALASTLAVTGAANLNNTLAVTGNTTLGGSLAVTAAASLSNTLGVAGNATFQQNVTVNGNLTVLGSQTAIDTTSLQVKDNAILIADMNVTDTLQSGVMVQYQPSGASAPKYAGMKRLPVSGSAGGEFVFFKDANSQISTSAESTSDVYAVVLADSFNCASDMNLKKNIVPLEGALDKIDQMRGVYHHWIDENQPQERQVGVIAQEVQAVYPELVTVGGNGYLSVNYPKLTAVLLQSVKELKAMIMQLAAQ